MKGYLIGTEVQEKSGWVRKKIGKNKWIGRGRYTWIKAHKKELTKNHKVYHVDGKKDNDNPKNLVAILFSGIVHVLESSRVIYRPKV